MIIKNGVLEGFTFIEIMISLLLVSFLLLALDASEFAALREAKNAYHQRVAMQQFNVILERLRALKGKNITDAVKDWNQQNKKVLPAGRGWVEAQNEGFILSIFWGNTALQTCNQNQIGQTGCLRLSVYL